MHKCKGAVVCCIDFRFQNYINIFAEKKFGKKNFDLISWAGSTKELELVTGQLEISNRLHGIEEVVLIHHEECGAYGKESTPEKHTSELQRAKKTIKERWPDLKVLMYYLRLDGSFEEVK